MQSSNLPYRYLKFEVTNAFCVAGLVGSGYYATLEDALKVADTINRHHRRGFYAYGAEVFVHEDGVRYTLEEYNNLQFQRAESIPSHRQSHWSF